MTTVRSLHIAGVCYLFRVPCRTAYSDGSLTVEGFSPTFVGSGGSRDKAMTDWQLKVHAAFQTLVNRRDEGKTDEERNRWSVLSQIIDVPAYLQATPLQVRQRGTVAGMQLLPGGVQSQIEWEDGSVEAFELDRVDRPDFITFRPGQPIEAIVSRRRDDLHLLRIVHIERRNLVEVQSLQINHRPTTDQPQNAMAENKTEMVFPELPFYLTVWRCDSETTVRVEVHSKVHVNKVVEMPTSFASDYVREYPSVFRDDVLRFVVKYYGLTKEPTKYS